MKVIIMDIGLIQTQQLIPVTVTDITAEMEVAGAYVSIYKKVMLERNSLKKVDKLRVDGKIREN